MDFCDAMDCARRQGLIHPEPRIRDLRCVSSLRILRLLFGLPGKHGDGTLPVSNADRRAVWESQLAGELDEKRLQKAAKGVEAMRAAAARAAGFRARRLGPVRPVLTLAGRRARAA